MHQAVQAAHLLWALHVAVHLVDSAVGDSVGDVQQGGDGAPRVQAHGGEARARDGARQEAREPRVRVDVRVEVGVVLVDGRVRERRAVGEDRARDVAAQVQQAALGNL
jgi:hypothetical protein